MKKKKKIPIGFDFSFHNFFLIKIGLKQHEKKYQETQIKIKTNIQLKKTGSSILIFFKGIAIERKSK